MQTRTLGPDDIERALEIRNRSFGVLAGESRAAYGDAMRKAIEAGTTIGAYDGDLLVGRALIWPFRQWWGGRDVAMAGIAGVVVAPEYRGRGVGSLLVDGLLVRGRELGFALSALYAATIPVYRRRGWEIAGAQYRHSIDAQLLRALRGSSVAVRQAVPDDAELLVRLMHEQYARGRDNGPKDEDVDGLRDELGSPGVFAYVAGDGFVVYGWDGPNLVVYRMIAPDAETARALWAIVGSGSSVAKTVHAYLSPDDAVVHLVDDALVRDAQVTRWMLRCLDAAAAIEGRGFPAGLDAEVPVVLDDAHVVENRFAGRLQVAGGRAALTAGPAEGGAVRLSANGLAALYAGVPTATLRSADLLTGGDAEAHAVLDAAFAGRPAYLLEFF